MPFSFISSHLLELFFHWITVKSRQKIIFSSLSDSFWHSFYIPSTRFDFGERRQKMIECDKCGRKIGYLDIVYGTDGKDTVCASCYIRYREETLIGDRKKLDKSVYIS
jgi:hypothetical protein